MNKKVFLSSRRGYGWLFTGILLFSGVFIITFSGLAIFVKLIVPEEEHFLKTIIDYVLYISYGLGGFALFVVWVYGIEEYWCELHIEYDQFVFKPKFKKSIAIKFEDSIYIGTANDRDSIRYAALYDDIADACGDTGRYGTYIYISTKPLPKKYWYRISKIVSKKGFIKFPYSDEVCLALIEALPGRTGELRAFYNQMQMKDKEFAKRKEKKLKKKMKAKELKKAKKLEKTNKKKQS